jgi:hypothetical protein
MNTDFERVRAFIDGAKTSLDWITSSNAPDPRKLSDFELGFRHALDAIGGQISDIDEEKSAPVTPAP